MAVEDIDFNSQSWMALKGWAEDEIENIRQDLETPQTDAVETEFLRGRIAALRCVLDLSVAGPEIGETTY